MENKGEVQEGEVYKVKVDAIGEQGDGICRVNGFVIIIKDQVTVGQEVTIIIDKIKAKFGFATLHNEE